MISNKGSPLHDAISNQDKAKVQQLLNEGANPNGPVHVHTGPPLMHALRTYGDSTEIVQLLISAKADVHWRKPQIRFPSRAPSSLLVFCFGSNCDVSTSKVNLLLHNGVRMNDSDEAFIDSFSIHYSSYRVFLQAYRIMGERVARCRRLCVAALWATPIQQHDLKVWWIREMVWSTRHDPIWTPDLPMPDGYT